MDMELSRPYCHRTDAPTLVTNLRRDMKKQMDLLATNMNTLDNVSFALNDGQKMLENRLCKNCKEAVKLKRTALHSKNETSHKKRKVKKLSPECQQMLNEITNIAMQLERFQNEDLDDEEYFTEEECYKQSMPEMERMNTNKQKDTEDEMRDMENKYKKMIQDKDADALSLRKQLEALKIESDDYKKKNDSMSIKLKSYEKSEKSEFDELSVEHKRLEEDELPSRDKELQTSRSDNGNQTLEHDELLQQIGRLQKERCSSIEMLGEKGSDLEVEECVENISQLQYEKHTLLDEARALINTMKEFSSTMESQQRDIDRVTGELEGKHADKSLPEEKEQDEKEISQQLTERQILQDQAGFLQKNNEKLSSTVKSLQRDVVRLTGELDGKQGDLDKLKKQNEEYVRDISHLHAEKHTLHEQTCSLNMTNEELSTTIESLQQDIERLTGESVKKDEEMNKIKKSLGDRRRLEKKLLVMRLMRGSQSGLDKAMMDMVTKELMRHLEGRIDSKSIEFSIVLCETSTDIYNGPLFVLCLNMSTDGRTIRDALGETKGGTDVYVLVLHHVNKKLTPTSHRVTGSEQRQLGGIIDLAFSSESGLYECNLNINGIEKIVTVLKKF